MSFAGLHKLAPQPSVPEKTVKDECIKKTKDSLDIEHEDDATDTKSVKQTTIETLRTAQEDNPFAYDPKYKVSLRVHK